MPPVNPFVDPLRFERRVPECVVVIFGANGDLTKRKLLPALYRLSYERRLAPGFAVLGISRTPMSDDQFRDRIRQSVAQYLEDSPFDEDIWTGFFQGLFYMAGDVQDPASFSTLATRLQAIEQTRQTGGNVVFYLSTQPWRRIGSVVSQPIAASPTAARYGSQRGVVLGSMPSAWCSIGFDGR